MISVQNLLLPSSGNSRKCVNERMEECLNAKIQTEHKSKKSSLYYFIKDIMY